MAAPTLVASYLPSGTTGGTGNWSSPTNPKTASVTAASGDVLVTLAAGADGQVTLTSPTGGTGVTWTTIADFGTSGASARATAFTSQPSAQTFTESISNTGPFNTTLQWSFITTRFSGCSGLGSPVSTTAGGSAPSLSITTTQANSGILVIIADWNAVAGTSYTYRQVNGANPTALVAGAGTAGNDYRVWVLWYPDAGAAGVKTVGMTAPSGQAPTMIALEVKGIVISNGSVTSVAATGTAAARVPAVTGTSSGIISGSPWSSPQAVTTGTASPVTAVAATATATARAPGALGVPLPMSGSPWSAPALVNTASANSPVLGAAATASATTGTPPVVTAERAVTGAGPGAASAQANAPIVAGTTGGGVTVVAVVASGAAATAAAPAVTVESVTTGGGPATATAFGTPPQVTATSTVIGGIIDVLVTVAAALALPPIATGTTDTPPVTGPTWLFSPPTHEEGIRVRGGWLSHFRITRANSIYWDGSRWVSVRALNNDIIRTLEEGVTYFRGGSPYFIDAATAQSLIAAGYTPILAT